MILKIRQFICSHKAIEIIATYEHTSQNLWKCPKCSVYVVQYRGTGMHYFCENPNIGGWIEERSVQMVTKEQYVIKRVKNVIKHHLDKDTLIKPKALDNLINQWAFDYEMEKAHNPKALEKPYETSPIDWDED